MKKIMIAGNWKMNTNLFEAQVLAEYIFGGVLQKPDLKVDVVLCPPFVNLSTVASVLKDTKKVLLGAQNCYHEVKGAYTGEISVPMLTEVGCKYIIIGHSERRTIFGETDELINKKVNAIMDYGYNAILCIGETLEEREAGKTFDVLYSQLDKCLTGVPNYKLRNIVVAYEPVWAIGTGVAATVNQVDDAHNKIREHLVESLGAPAKDMLILYGGSMKPSNAAELLKLENVNGGLIGGAALDPEQFLDIIESARKISE